MNCWIIDCHALSPAVQPISNPDNDLFVQSILPQLTKETTMGNNVKSLAKSKVYYSTALTLSTQPVISSRRAIRLVKCGLPKVDLCWLFPIYLLVLPMCGNGLQRMCSMVLPEMKRNRLSEILLSPFLQVGVTSVLSWSLRTFPNHCDLLQVINSGHTVTSSSSSPRCFHPEMKTIHLHGFEYLHLPCVVSNLLLLHCWPSLSFPSNSDMCRGLRGRFTGEDREKKGV